MIKLGFKKNLIAVLVISVLGVLGHFLYEWTDNNAFVGCFFPVNESIWEHLKLVFFPSLIYFSYEYFTSKTKPQNYIPATIKGIYYGMLTVVVSYYTVTGVIGKNIDFINILIYFVSVFVTVSYRNSVIANDKEFSKAKVGILIFVFAITALLFAVWGFNPPNLNIFVEPNLR